MALPVAMEMCKLGDDVLVSILVRRTWRLCGDSDVPRGRSQQQQQEQEQQQHLRLDILVPKIAYLPKCTPELRRKYRMEGGGRPEI